MGPDGIHPGVLNGPAHVTATPLSIIYQRPWESGQITADWKLTSVIPLYKGMRQETGNWRLISVTSAPGKTMEILSVIGR